MPITKVNDVIVETEATDQARALLTDVHRSDQFALCDKNDPLKQVQFDISDMPTDTVSTLKFVAGGPMEFVDGGTITGDLVVTGELSVPSITSASGGTMGGDLVIGEDGALRQGGVLRLESTTRLQLQGKGEGVHVDIETQADSGVSGQVGIGSGSTYAAQSGDVLVTTGDVQTDGMTEAGSGSIQLYTGIPDFGTRGSIILNGLAVDTQGTPILYTPTTSGDWAGTAPTSIQEALDRCAALLKTLNTGTGP